MLFSKNFFFILSDSNTIREKNILSSFLYLLLKNNFFFPKYFLLNSFNQINSAKNIFFSSDGYKIDNNYSYYEKITNEYIFRDNVLTLESYYIEYLKNNSDNGIYFSDIYKFIDMFVEKKIFNNKYNDSFIFEFFNFNSFIDIIPFVEMIKKIKIIFPKNVFVFYFSLVPYLSSLKEFKLKPIYNSIKELLNFSLPPDLFFLNSRYKLNKEIISNISFFTNIKTNNIINFCESNSVFDFYEFLNHSNLVYNFFKSLNIFNNKCIFIRENNFIKKNKKEFFLCYLCYKKDFLLNYNNILDSFFFSSNLLNIDIKFSIISLEKVENFNVFLSFDGIVLSENLKKTNLNLELNVLKFIKQKNIPFLGIEYGFYLSVLEILNKYLKKKDFLKFYSCFKKKRISGCQSVLFFTKELSGKCFYKEVSFEKFFSVYSVKKKYYKYFTSNFYSFRSFLLKGNIINEILYLNNDFFLIIQHHPELNSFLSNPNRIFVEFLNFLINKKEKY